MKYPWKKLFTTQNMTDVLEAMNMPGGVLVRSTRFVENVGLQSMVFVRGAKVIQDPETQEYLLRHGEPRLTENI